MLPDYLLIAGFTGRTSYQMAKVLLDRGERLIISDNVSNPEKKALVGELKKKGDVLDLLGDQDPLILDRFPIKLLLKSPGVPPGIPLVSTACKRGIPVIGDIELFYSYKPGSTYIGITGTDGKTTTTTLVYEMIRREKNAFIGGNIGVPVFEHYQNAGPDAVFVLELSSFQLETTRTFKPFIAACLNIAEDHLDRYSSISGYIDAKKNIFKNQDPMDYAVLNLDSPYFKILKKGIRSKILTFGTGNKKADLFFSGDTLYYHGIEFIKRKDIKLRGIHNVENSMAAILIAKKAGISDSAVIETLKSFEGLEHRLELVTEYEGVTYYNDSKSTTVNALSKALLSFDSPIILIAGGRDKGLDFKKIRTLVHRKLKNLVLIGEAASKIRKELSFPSCYMAENLEDAVEYSRKVSVKGDIVLLSPGCASFDMFEDFEQRGRKFKELVTSMKP